MSVSLLACYFLTKIRQIWGYLHFWMRYLSEIFLRHSWDIGSLVFTLLGWGYILTVEFLCARLNLLPFGYLRVSFWDLLVLFLLKLCISVSKLTTTFKLLVLISSHHLPEKALTLFYDYLYWYLWITNLKLSSTMSLVVRKTRDQYVLLIP